MSLLHKQLGEKKETINVLVLIKLEGYGLIFGFERIRSSMKSEAYRQDRHGNDLNNYKFIFTSHSLCFF